MSDLIDRQAAIDALDEIESEVADGYGYQYEKWRKYFCGLPSAQPQRMKGRWIRDDFGSFCESCGLYAYLDKFGEVWESNYCPNCGADMRGEYDADD